MDSKWKERFEGLEGSVAELSEKAKGLKEDAQAYRELRKEVIDDKIGTLKGDVEAAKENIRIAGEKNKSKISSALLKAQMTVEAKVQDRKEARDRKDLENFIDGRVDYVEDCFITASYLIQDAQIALLEALAAAEEYEERFGEKEAE